MKKLIIKIEFPEMSNDEIELVDKILEKENYLSEVTQLKPKNDKMLELKFKINKILKSLRNNI